MAAENDTDIEDDLSRGAYIYRRTVPISMLIAF